MMNHFEPEPVAAYLPHESPMILLETLVSISPEEVVAQVSVSADGVLSPFLTVEGDLPGWYAIEMMAQAIGVWSGWHGMQNGRPPLLGMLLGVRGFEIDLPVFSNEMILDVSALQLMSDGKLGSFSCLVRCAGNVLAKSQINVYQPSEDEYQQLFGKLNKA